MLIFLTPDIAVDPVILLSKKHPKLFQTAKSVLITCRASKIWNDDDFTEELQIEAPHLGGIRIEIEWENKPRHTVIDALTLTRRHLTNISEICDVMLHSELQVFRKQDAIYPECCTAEIYLIHDEWLVYSWDESECTAEENQQIIYFVKGVLAGSPRSSNCLCADDDSDSD